MCRPTPGPSASTAPAASWRRGPQGTPAHGCRERWFGQRPELVCLPQLHDFLSVDVYFETIHPLESDCLSKQFKTLDTVMRPGALVKTGSCSQQTTTKRLAKNAPAERYALYITHTSILVTPRPPHTGIYLFRHEIVGASGLRHIMRPVHQMSRS